MDFNFQITFNAGPYLAIIASLVAWFIPAFQTLPERKKQLWMLGFAAFVVLVALLGSLPFIDFWHVYAYARWQDWIIYPVTDLLAVIFSNYGFYGATKYVMEALAKAKDRSGGG